MLQLIQVQGELLIQEFGTDLLKLPNGALILLGRYGI